MTVLLIVDNNAYRFILGNFLAQHNIDVGGSYTHKSSIGKELDPMPNVAIISYRSSKPETLETAAFVRDKYPQ